MAIARWILGSTRFRTFGVELEYGSWRLTAERRVEIPFALEFLRSNVKPDTSLLEVGNVLSQYTSMAHVTVDKYDRQSGIHCQDVVDFAPEQRFDVAISISTLEHVGFDEDVVDLEKFERAFWHIMDRCLNEGGWFLLTVPLGYHPEVDRAVLSGNLGVGTVQILKYSSPLGTWHELRAGDVLSRGILNYPYELHRANYLALWVIQKGR